MYRDILCPDCLLAVLALRPQEPTGRLCLPCAAEAAWEEHDKRSIAALRARVADLETALATLLDAAERQAAGFPLPAEQWFAVRDYARARLPEKRADGAEEVERE